MSGSKGPATARRSATVSRNTVPRNSARSRSKDAGLGGCGCGSNATQHSSQHGDQYGSHTSQQPFKGLLGRSGALSLSGLGNSSSPVISSADIDVRVLGFEHHDTGRGTLHVEVHPQRNKVFAPGRCMATWIVIRDAETGAPVGSNRFTGQYAASCVQDARIPIAQITGNVTLEAFDDGIFAGRSREDVENWQDTWTVEPIATSRTVALRDTETGRETGDYSLPVREREKLEGPGFLEQYGNTFVDASGNVASTLRWTAFLGAGGAALYLGWPIISDISTRTAVYLSS